MTQIYNFIQQNRIKIFYSNVSGGQTIDQQHIALTVQIINILIGCIVCIMCTMCIGGITTKCESHSIALKCDYTLILVFDYFFIIMNFLIMIQHCSSDNSGSECGYVSYIHIFICKYIWFCISVCVWVCYDWVVFMIFETVNVFSTVLQTLFDYPCTKTLALSVF